METTVTFVHVQSESTDNYYLSFDGKIPEDDLDDLVAEKLDFEDPDLLYVEAVHYHTVSNA